MKWITQLRKLYNTTIFQPSIPMLIPHKKLEKSTRYYYIVYIRMKHVFHLSNVDSGNKDKDNDISTRFFKYYKKLAHIKKSKIYSFSFQVLTWKCYSVCTYIPRIEASSWSVSNVRIHQVKINFKDVTCLTLVIGQFWQLIFLISGQFVFLDNDAVVVFISFILFFFMMCLLCWLVLDYDIRVMFLIPWFLRWLGDNQIENLGKECFNNLPKLEHL